MQLHLQVGCTQWEIARAPAWSSMLPPLPTPLQARTARGQTRRATQMAAVMACSGRTG